MKIPKFLPVFDKNLAKSKPIDACGTKSKERAAYESTAFRNLTVLMVLFLGHGLCGKADVLNIQTNLLGAGFAIRKYA